jgi:hypothetical protein
MVIRDLERIRFITQHFNDLQGLRVGVPLGLITLAWGAPALPRAVLWLAALLLLLGARRYYRSLGHVEQQPADPAAELCPASIFNPAGPFSRLDGFQQVTPIARHFLATLAVAVALFSFFQAIPPKFLIQGDGSPGRPLRSVPELAFETRFEPVFLHGSTWLGGLPMKRPDGAGIRAVLAQTMYVLYGSLFLGIWLWRGRHESQRFHLVLAVPLLGLAALGTSLGFFARPGGGDIPPDFALFLPALIDPGTALLLCGSSMILMGLFDHWQLARTLGWSIAAAEEES